MDQPQQEIEQLINQAYVPSSLERKRTVLMYALFGIILTLISKDLSTYEQFHLKQSIGRRLIFLLTLTASVVLFFIKYLNLIPIIILIPLIVVLFIFGKQAWDGQYTLESGKIFLPVFAGLGGRTLDLFDLHTNVTDKENNKT